MTYLNNLVAAYELVDVFAWAAIEEDAGQVDGTLPGLEAAFVDAGADVRFVEVFQRLVVGCFVFGHQLDANVGEVAARYIDGFARRRFDLDRAVAEVIGQCRELRGKVSHECYRLQARVVLEDQIVFSSLDW